MPYSNITGVILAGGRSSRMGGMDKGWVELAGKPLVEHVITRLKPQVKSVMINANRNIERYGIYGLPIVGDEAGEFFGPLAGMLSAMRVAKTRYILTAPCDSPMLPTDLAQRMFSSLLRGSAKVCVAHDGVKMQPVFALMSCTLKESLSSYLASGERKVETWLKEHKPAQADFSDQPWAFLNINSPQDLLEEQLRLAKLC